MESELPGIILVKSSHQKYTAWAQHQAVFAM